MITRRKKQNYEGMYIIRASLSDDARQKAIEKITALVENLEGKIHKVIDWGRRKLKYDIKSCREGHYVIIYFSAYTDTIKEMWQEYHLHEDLLRFFTLEIEEIPEQDRIEFKHLAEV